MVDPRKLNPESIVEKEKQPNLLHRIPKRPRNWLLHVSMEEDEGVGTTIRIEVEVQAD